VTTKAITAFSSTHERAGTLLKLHSSGTAGRPKKEKEDILRAAVMLAVAAVDSYFHDKILERLTPLLQARKGKNLPGDLIKLLEKNCGVEKLLGVLYEERPHRHIHTIVKQAQADLTFQKPDKIENALKLIGISDFWYKVAVKMGHGTSKESLKRKLGQYAARRDKIAHEADRAPGSTLNKISRPYVKECLNFVDRFIKGADTMIDKATES
jgi:RiboL-PSP-HEPN